MKKVLFLIHDLMGGGAEKVLVNLVNNLDQSKFDITVMSLFDVGVNKKYIKKGIHYKYVYKKMFRGNQHFMKLFAPEVLHKRYIKDLYDIEVAYLEGPCARIISGCTNIHTKTVAWIHCTMKSKKQVAESFRSYAEAEASYNKFNKLVFVSKDTQKSFSDYCTSSSPQCVLYNTNETEKILLESQEYVEGIGCDGKIKLIGTGKLEKLKGFDRIISIHKRLVDEGYPVKTYILGRGKEEENLKTLISDLGINDSFTLLGYQSNPHKYVSKCDLFICASFSEGFSTAATEALIVGTPVCTVNVSGMKEMLGNNEYGLITENSETALYEGIKSLLDNPKLLAYYKQQAAIRGKIFSRESTVNAVEKMLMEDE